MSRISEDNTREWRRSPSSLSLDTDAAETSCSAMGTAALLLQVVPVVNVLFAFTNAAGAALYAADLEKGTNSLEESAKAQ